MSGISTRHGPVYLGEFELIVLLAIAGLHDDAYGVTIQAALERDLLTSGVDLRRELRSG